MGEEKLTVRSPQGYLLSAHELRMLVNLAVQPRYDRRAQPTLVRLSNYGMAEHRYVPVPITPKLNVSKWFITEAGRLALQSGEKQ